MAWFCFWMIALYNSEQGAGEATDWMKPAAWKGNYWGPDATRARLAGQLPPLPTNAVMTRWGPWGRQVLREGDIVFRLGDARIVRGMFPLSRFIARSTGSPFSHTGIVAIEDGAPVVYDCSSEGVRRQPFEVWMLDCVGAMGVKRLKPEHRRHIPGVIGYCRGKFEQQVPFDYRVSPGRYGALLPRTDREGLPIAGPGTLRASPDRRLGASDQLSADRVRAPLRLGAGARPAIHTRAAGVSYPGTSATGSGAPPCWRRSSTRNHRATAKLHQERPTALACVAISRWFSTSLSRCAVLTRCYPYDGSVRSFNGREFESSWWPPVRQ